MKSFFYERDMWCESKNPRIQTASRLLLSKELKSFVCIIVVYLIAVNMLSLIKDPFNRRVNYCKKKFKDITKSTTSTMKSRSESLNQPVVKSSPYVYRRVLLHFSYERRQRAEVVMMLVDEQQRDRLESHAQFYQPK